MGTLKAWDAINGAEGRCYANIDGQIEEFIYAKDIVAKIEKNKSEIKVLGQTGSKHKANGWKGTGSMTMYYASSLFRKLMVEYVKTGKDLYFDMFVENSDPTSEIGTQKIWLKQVNINSIIMAKLDVNSTELDEEVEFTFNGVEIMEEFAPAEGE